MELDKRIKEGKKPLTCFDTEQAKEFLGKECFFSNCKVHYKNLSAFEKFENLTDYCIGTLTAIMDLGDRVFDVDQRCKEFRYCLPCEWVKPEEPEKKYRSYKNVQELFEDIGVYIGDTIHFRSKAEGTESHSLITSYTTLKDGTEKICLGGAFYYTMQALFDLFELRSRGEWQPFGVIDEQE